MNDIIYFLLKVCWVLILPVMMFLVWIGINTQLLWLGGLLSNFLEKAVE